jgi:sigma-E factor negative regulatory protein RseC
MIEEIGTVVAVKGDNVWVETQVKTTCSGCKASEGCPSSTIAKAFTSKANLVYMEVPCALVVGQQIKIGISEHALLRASLMVYVIPLLLLIFSAAALSAMLPNVHELIILLAASFIAFLGFWWASAFSKSPKHKEQFAPIFLGATIDPVVTHKQEIPVHKIEP